MNEHNALKFREFRFRKNNRKYHELQIQNLIILKVFNDRIKNSLLVKIKLYSNNIKRKTKHKVYE